MGCLLAIVVWGWALLLTMGAFGALADKGGGGIFLLALAVGWAPVGVMFSMGRAKKANRKRLRDEVALQAGVAVNSQLFHWEWESGLALNEQQGTLTVAAGGHIKTYPFADVREWAVRSERAGQIVPMGGGLAGGIAAGAANVGAAGQAAANTGLFISVKDINHPTWRIAMQSKAKRDSWFEILTQALNEGGTRGAKT